MAVSMAVRIAVLGSLNVDLTVRTRRLPSAGETLTASRFSESPGGKGANQAVACAILAAADRPSSRAGGRHAAPTIHVAMVGAVGHDAFGDKLLSAVHARGVDVRAVRRVRDTPTGTAVVIVEEESGENRILLAPGANDVWDPTVACLPEATDVAILQLEIPLEAVLTNLRAAKDNGVELILNPAPAVPVPADALQHVDHLIVNETEACILSGRQCRPLAAAECQSIAAEFVAVGVKNVVITLGSNGLFYQSSTSKCGSMIASHKVEVRDTTGAGDVFVAAYCVARIMTGMGPGRPFDLEVAVRFANCAAAASVQREGAMNGIPSLHDVVSLAKELDLPDRCWSWAA